MNTFLLRFPAMAAYQPVINGVAGNLVSVQASRLSTALHQRQEQKRKSKDHEEEEEDEEKYQQEAGRSKLLLLAMVVPGHLMFNALISLLQVSTEKGFLIIFELGIIKVFLWSKLQCKLG